MARWSKLQSELYKVISDDIDFQIHCVVYRTRVTHDHIGIPRYWITIEKEIVWDYPGNFLGITGKVDKYFPSYHPKSDIPIISSLIKEYIDSPREGLLQKEFENDKWGLTDILKIADRRIGKRQLTELQKKIENNNHTITNIIELRLRKQKLETALTKTKKELKEGKFVKEPVEEHIKRIVTNK